MGQGGGEAIENGRRSDTSRPANSGVPKADAGRGKLPANGSGDDSQAAAGIKGAEYDASKAKSSANDEAAKDQLNSQLLKK